MVALSTKRAQCNYLGILMLLSHWGCGIFVFSPSFTHFHPFSTHSAAFGAPEMARLGSHF